MAVKIAPISGFPEFMPAEQIVVNKWLDTIRRTYEAFGFAPLETAAVERVEYLLAKGIEAKEVYGLRRLAAAEDDGAKDLALRFDLTVPLARFVAQHHGALRFPFRRYQMQPVWRGERAQAGRYRQFVQCDIDVIGDGELSLEHDAEIPAVIFMLFRRLGIGKFTIRINNRRILSGLFESVGLAGDGPIRAAMNAVDELDRIGPGRVVEKLLAVGLDKEKAERILAFFDIKGDNDAVLARLKAMAANATFEAGVAELERVVGAAAAHVPRRFEDGELVSVEDERALFPAHFQVDLGIARGLDYYTGTVYETRLDAAPKIGSICSGGRYENLVGNFVDRKFPGVGISIGLTRLMARLFESGLVKAGGTAVAPVLVTVQDPSCLDRYKEIAARLRLAGIRTELFLEAKRLDKQIQYADRKGFPLVVVANREELERDTVVLKNMRARQEQRVGIAQLPPLVRSMTPPEFD